MCERERDGGGEKQFTGPASVWTMLQYRHVRPYSIKS